MILLLLLACGLDTLPTEVRDAEPTYTRDIAPLYAQHCVRCHHRDGVMDGGVELDSYEAARSTRVSATCSAVGQAVIDEFGDDLLPLAGHGPQIPCLDWEPASMPPGAGSHLSLVDQVILARWVQIGAPE